MYRRRAGRNIVARLALLATCLLLFAPSISRVLSLPPMDMAMPMSMAMSMQDTCGEQAPHGPKDHADALDACAYCALVTHGVALGDAVVFTVPLVPSAPATTPSAGRRIDALAVQRAPARGPPVLA